MSWTFGDLLDRAAQAQAVKLHLSIGHPPMMRVPDRGVIPVDSEYGDITQPELMRMLSILVEPEDWAEIEATGEGEVSLASTYGLPLKMVLYKSLGQWAAVVHL